MSVKIIETHSKRKTVFPTEHKLSWWKKDEFTPKSDAEISAYVKKVLDADNAKLEKKFRW